MKVISFKNIAFATLLLTSTANAYFDTQELSSLSDEELWDKSLHLASKTLSIAKNPQEKNRYEYNLYKLSVLSLEEERRGFTTPIFSSDPERNITFGVYAHILSKYSSLVSNTHPDLLDDIVNRYPEDSLLSLAALNEFVTTIGLQKKSANTSPPAMTENKENNSQVVVSTKEEEEDRQEQLRLREEEDRQERFRVDNDLHLKKEEDDSLKKEEEASQPSSPETVENSINNSDHDAVTVPQKEENIFESLPDLSSSKLTDVRKKRVANKNKRPPTIRGLRGLKKNITQEETQPSLTTELTKPQEETDLSLTTELAKSQEETQPSLTIELAKPQEETQPSLTTELTKPQEETQPSLITEVEKPQEEKKVEVEVEVEVEAAPPVENELTEKEKRIRRITQGGVQLMMPVLNMGKSTLRKSTLNPTKPSNVLPNQTDFRSTLKKTTLASKKVSPPNLGEKSTEDTQN